MLGNWEEVSDGQAYSPILSGGKNDFNFLHKTVLIIPLFGKVHNTWQVAFKWLWPVQDYHYYSSSSNDFLQARNFNRLIS